MYQATWLLAELNNRVQNTLPFMTDNDEEQTHHSRKKGNRHFCDQISTPVSNVMREKPLLLSAGLLNDGHAGDLLPVLPQATPQVLQEAPVDVIDDLHVAGQQALHQADRPLLQRLWQHCVVGEGKHL